MLVFRLIVLALFTQIPVFAGDTLKITVQQADSLLVVRNLSLIASHYEVDRAKAAVIQARLLNNPELSTEWNLYNPDKGEWFDVGGRGQKIIAIQQVFRIAGQRRAGIMLAEDQTRLSEFQFQELARSLKYELHTAFYRAHFLSKAVNNIHSQLVLLKNLIDEYGDQYRKGNISLQELTRLNATYFTINSQVTDVRHELAILQEHLKILLAEDRFIFPVTSGLIEVDVSDLSLDEMIDKGLSNRPEIKTLLALESQRHLQYALARKEAMPNVTAGIIYDRAGSYVNNYTGVTVGLQIPVFNRNQGQVQAARIGIGQAKVELQAKQQRITAEIESAWNVLNILLEQYNGVNPDFENELDLLSEALVSNYSKNNISLLEFTDLFEAYNTNIIQYNQLKADLRKSYEELIYAVGE